jgi:hypothetical protein
MSIKAKIAALTAVALAITGSVASTTTPAEAHGFSHYGFSHYGFNHYGFNHYDFNHYGFGSEIAANDGYEYGGDHYCRWVPRFDIQGNYIGRLRNCGD